MGVILQCVVYSLIGFVQEILIVIYHRATGTGRKSLAALMTALITITSLMVMAQITHQILAFGGFISFFYVLSYASGKGIGAYMALECWDHYHRKKE